MYMRSGNLSVRLVIGEPHFGQKPAWVIAPLSLEEANSLIVPEHLNLAFGTANADE